MILHVLLFVAILIPSLVEGLGLFVDRRIWLLYFSSIPSFFYIYTTFSPKSLQIPLKAGKAYLYFFFISLISTFFFSLDKQVSFELLLFYFSIFLLFIFFYNHKKEGKLIFFGFPLILGVFFTFYSFLIPFFKAQGFRFLLPVFEKQLIFASYGDHNHLGDFLGLLLIVLSYHFIKKRFTFLPLFLFFFVVFIFSFSRSSYIAFFIVFVFMLLTTRKEVPSRLLPFLFFFLSIIVFITYILSFQQPNYSPLFKFQEYVRKTWNISPRGTFTSGREMLLTQSLSSIQKNPLFGIGAGNFHIASKNSDEGAGFSDSAHNIVFEIATGQGVLAAVFFMLFIFLISKHILFSPSLSGYLFLYLLLNFQTDYTYQIYSLFLFWILLSSLSYKEGKEVSISSFLYGLLCIIPLAITVCIVTSVLLVQNNDNKNAIRWYPFNKEAYGNAIEHSDNNIQFTIQNALLLAPYDQGFNSKSAEYYEKMGDKKMALRYYEKIYELNQQCSFSIVKKIYRLKRDAVSYDEADRFLKDIVRNYQNIFATDLLKKEFTDFCKEMKIENCPRVGWNQ